VERGADRSVKLLDAEAFAALGVEGL
jgi:hypothetical protein